jgi:hypothetical protein
VLCKILARRNAMARIGLRPRGLRLLAQVFLLSRDVIHAVKHALLLTHEQVHGINRHYGIANTASNWLLMKQAPLSRRLDGTTEERGLHTAP